MDKKTILSQIKQLIKFSDAKFKDAKLIDGETIIKVDADNWAVGLPLFVVTPDGLIPAPVGEHTTLDGYKITVDEAGIITNVEEVEVEVEVEEVETPAAEAVVETELAEEVKVEEEVKEEVKVEDTAKVEELGNKIKEMEAKIATIEKMMNEMVPVVQQTAEFSSAVLGKLETFIAETPATLEFKSLKSDYKQFVKDNKENKFSGLEGIKNIRSKK